MNFDLITLIRMVTRGHVVSLVSSKMLEADVGFPPHVKTELMSAIRQAGSG